MRGYTSTAARRTGRAVPSDYHGVNLQAFVFRRIDAASFAVRSVGFRSLAVGLLAVLAVGTADVRPSAVGLVLLAGGAVLHTLAVRALGLKRTCYGMELGAAPRAAVSEKDPKDPVWCPVEGAPGWSVELQRTRPALGQLARSRWRYGLGGPEGVEGLNRSPDARGYYMDQSRGVARLLANIQPVEPELPMLRAYSQVSDVQRMGDRGENFAALVQTICKDERTKDAYLSWLRQLRPEEIDDVGVRQGAMDEPLFMLRENGREFPAAVLSDGTLRFAALAAAFFQPDMPDLRADGRAAFH